MPKIKTDPDENLQENETEIPNIGKVNESKIKTETVDKLNSGVSQGSTITTTTKHFDLSPNISEIRIKTEKDTNVLDNGNIEIESATASQRNSSVKAALNNINDNVNHENFVDDLPVTPVPHSETIEKSNIQRNAIDEIQTNNMLNNINEEETDEILDDLPATPEYNKESEEEQTVDKTTVAVTNVQKNSMASNFPLIRIKTEKEINNAECKTSNNDTAINASNCDTLPDDYFESILREADDIKPEIPDQNHLATIDSEKDITEDYFHDIVNGNELNNYPQFDYEEAKPLQSAANEATKHKKKHSKSRKRRRDSESDFQLIKEVKRPAKSPSIEIKREKRSPSLNDSTSHIKKKKKKDKKEKHSRRPTIKIKSEPTDKVTSVDRHKATDSNSNIAEIQNFKLEKTIDDNITYPRETGLKYAAKALEILGRKVPNKHLLFSPKLYTLPNSKAFQNNEIYEFRSPIQSINKVDFNFNTLVKKKELIEWGLAKYQPQVTEIAQALNCDVNVINIEKKSIKIPIEPKNTQENTSKTNIKNGKKFNVHVATQTEEKNCFSIGIQASISDNRSSDENTETSYLQELKTLNENQLMAVMDFCTLIRNPVIRSPVEMLDVRKRLFEIYKDACKPSMFEKKNELPERIHETTENSNIYINTPTSTTILPSYYNHQSQVHVPQAPIPQTHIPQLHTPQFHLPERQAMYTNEAYQRRIHFPPASIQPIENYGDPRVNYQHRQIQHEHSLNKKNYGRGATKR